MTTPLARCFEISEQRVWLLLLFTLSRIDPERLTGLIPGCDVISHRIRIEGGKRKAEY
jgi:hypothetical protein